jgi:hypothetical protein
MQQSAAALLANGSWEDNCGRFRSATLVDPLEGLFEGFLGVGLEHNALTRSPSPNIHASVILLRKFVEIVAVVTIPPQVDVALRALERPHVLCHTVRRRIAVDEGRDHESGINHLAEPELPGEVIGAGEQRAGDRLTFDQLVHAGEQQAVTEIELDLIR